MSAHHSTFGAVGLNFRSTRSSATLTPGTRIVVRPRRLGSSPEIPACAISRSTRLRADTDVASEAQLGMDPRGPIYAAVGLVDLLDLLEQPQVGELAV